MYYYPRSYKSLVESYKILDSEASTLNDIKIETQSDDDDAQSDISSIEKQINKASSNIENAVSAMKSEIQDIVYTDLENAQKIYITFVEMEKEESSFPFSDWIEQLLMPDLGYNFNTNFLMGIVEPLITMGRNDLAFENIRDYLHAMHKMNPTDYKSLFSHIEQGCALLPESMRENALDALLLNEYTSYTQLIENNYTKEHNEYAYSYLALKADKPDIKNKFINVLYETSENKENTTKTIVNSLINRYGKNSVLFNSSKFNWDKIHEIITDPVFIQHEISLPLIENINELCDKYSWLIKENDKVKQENINKMLATYHMIILDRDLPAATVPRKTVKI